MNFNNHPDEIGERDITTLEFSEIHYLFMLIFYEAQRNVNKLLVELEKGSNNSLEMLLAFTDTPRRNVIFKSLTKFKKQIFQMESKWRNTKIKSIYWKIRTAG